jgi:FkbM family methyltransferase
MLDRAIDALLRSYARIAPTSRGGYRLARFARRFHGSANRVGVFQTPHGVRLGLDLDVYPDCSMAYGLFEVETVRVLRSILRPGDTFIDGGANVGYFTVLAAKIVGERGRVHAFEPHPDNVTRLQQNVVENGVASSVTIHPVALADRPGEMQLHILGEANTNHALATFFAAPGTQTRAVTVSVVRLDDYLPAVAPRLIKLDIEGAEPLAISGMVATLRRHRPAVIVEMNAGALGRAGSSPEELLAALLDAVPAYRPELIGWKRTPLRTLNLRNDVNILLRGE